MPELRHLLLSDTQVSREAVSALQKALPKCEITYFPHICLAISGHFGLSDTVTCRLAGRRASRFVASVSPG